MGAIVFKYFEGLQWVIHYYYSGVASWGWFYNYHYAPRISGIYFFRGSPAHSHSWLTNARRSKGCWWDVFWLRTGEAVPALPTAYGCDASGEQGTHTWNIPRRSNRTIPCRCHSQWSVEQDLMENPNSPIIDFYPTDFEQDLNGKKQDWEAIVKIPFIDEERLITAMSSMYATECSPIWLTDTPPSSSWSRSDTRGATKE